MDAAAAWGGDEEVRNGIAGQRDLNFGGTVVGQCEDDGDDGFRRRVSRDPMSHRIIEKRRRDRMNSCLADLSRLIPAEYLKRGRGRIEKTEIIEMAIRHMRHLQESQQPFLPLGQPTPPLTTSSSSSSSPGSCSSSPVTTSMSNHQEVCEMADEGGAAVSRHGPSVSLGKEASSSDQYRLGFLECLSEVLHFLIEVEGFPAGGSLCLSLDAHLRNHCSAMLQGASLASTKTEYTLDEENHFQMEMPQTKSLELPGLDVPESQGNLDLESVAKGTECRDCEAYRSSELRVVLTRNEQEQNGGGEPSILSLQPAPDDSGGGASYKFKSNIKRRFTAGLEKRRKFEEGDGKKCPSEGRDESRCVSITNSTMQSLVPPHPSNAVQPSSKCAPGSQAPHSPQPDPLAPHRIPVFALHSEHAFYVPLMLDPDALAPHTALLSKHASALHPVTISVNFCSNNGGVVDECEEQGHNDSPLLISRDYSCSTPSSAMAESVSKHNYRHWRPVEGYLSQ